MFYCCINEYFHLVYRRRLISRAINFANSMVFDENTRCSLKAIILSLKNAFSPERNRELYFLLAKFTALELKLVPYTVALSIMLALVSEIEVPYLTIQMPCVF